MPFFSFDPVEERAASSNPLCTFAEYLSRSSLQLLPGDSAHAELLQLAGHGSGKFVDEPDELRRFDVGHVGAAVGAHFLAVGVLLPLST